MGTRWLCRLDAVASDLGMDRPEAIHAALLHWLEDTSDTEAHDDLRPLFVNGFHPDRSPDLTLQFEPFFVPTRTTAATHGSAWPYDTWVPLVIRSAGLGAARVEQSVRSVDMAPTLAALAAITVPEGLDGVDLIGRVGMRAH